MQKTSRRRKTLLGMASTEWMLVLATLGASTLAIFYLFFPDFRERFEQVGADQRSILGP